MTSNLRISKNILGNICGDYRLYSTYELPEWPLSKDFAQPELLFRLAAVCHLQQYNLTVIIILESSVDRL